jgi:uncharacterized FAD-dependent dehydrogenase
MTTELLIRDVRVPLEAAGEDPVVLAAAHLCVPADQVTGAEIVRRSIDARRGRPRFALSMRVQMDQVPAQLPQGAVAAPEEEPLAPPPKVSGRHDVVIVGAGPAGLFAALRMCQAGLKPTIVDRGRELESRQRDVSNLFINGLLDPESNLHFGLGGAGAFSDGKLFTRQTHPAVRTVLSVLQGHGAGSRDEILVDSQPHVGTDRWPVALERFREDLESKGCSFLFETKVTGLEMHEGRLSALVLEEGRLPCEAAVMAPGNSSRDLFEGLHAAGVPLSPKSFAVGVRMTHPQDIIDRIQYRGYAGHPALPTASYQLTEKVGDRGVYSFCMCPGGAVIPTPTEPRRLALNGMSNAARDSGEANSAVVVTVTPKDLGADDPLAGIQFQRKLEEAAYQAGGGGYQAPAQRLREFLEGAKPSELPEVGYQPGVTPADLHSLLPGWITEPLVKGMSAFFSKMKELDSPQSVVLGIETRTSSPVRILRSADGMSPQVAGLFPAGEGSGYAGGITSSAVDGIRAADELLHWLGRT